MNQWIHIGSSFLFPAGLMLELRVRKSEEPSGEEVLRLIQIRLATPSLTKIPTCQTNSRRPDKQRIKVQKRRQLFIRTHNETLSVAPIPQQSRLFVRETKKC